MNEVDIHELCLDPTKYCIKCGKETAEIDDSEGVHFYFPPQVVLFYGCSNCQALWSIRGEVQCP